MCWPDSRGFTAMLPLGGVLGPPSFPCGFRTGGSNGLVAGRHFEVLMPNTKIKNDGMPELEWTSFHFSDIANCLILAIARISFPIAPGCRRFCRPLTTQAPT
jgi:hypothetical protein